VHWWAHKDRRSAGQSVTYREWVSSQNPPFMRGTAAQCPTEERVIARPLSSVFRSEDEFGVKMRKDLP